MNAERLPMALGVKFTVTVQVAPTLRLVPQSLLCAKSPLSTPATAKPRLLTVQGPAFVSVMVIGALGVPTG
jgi:hypothetical protein